MWYYIKEYYSDIKKKEILPSAITCMNLEDIMLSEISDTEKDKYCMILLISGIWRGKNLIDTENRLVVARGGEWVKWVNGVKRYKLLINR